MFKAQQSNKLEAEAKLRKGKDPKHARIRADEVLLWQTDTPTPGLEGNSLQGKASRALGFLRPWLLKKTLATWYIPKYRNTTSPSTSSVWWHSAPNCSPTCPEAAAPCISSASAVAHLNSRRKSFHARTAHDTCQWGPAKTRLGHMPDLALFPLKNAGFPSNNCDLDQVRAGRFEMRAVHDGCSLSKWHRPKASLTRGFDNVLQHMK